MEFAGLPPGSSAKAKSPRRKNGRNYSTRAKAKKADLLKPKPPSPSSSSASSLSSAPPFGSFPGVVRSRERPEFCDEEEVKRVRNEVDARTRTLVKKNLGIASSSSDVPPPKRARRKCKVKRAERAPIAVGSGVPKLPKAKPRKAGKEPITAISIRRWYGRDP